MKKQSKPMVKPPTKDENGNDIDALSEILSVMDVEKLLRLRKQLELHKRKVLVDWMGTIIKEREKD
jgi:hypothetical protein